MTNKISEQKLRIEFPQFFEKIDTVIFESRKYNLIDRLFHFFIEDNELLKYVNSLKVEEKIKIELLNYIGLLDSEIDLLVEKIKKCYGIESVNFHKNSERILFIDNPSLLGVSPFLFDQNIWADIIIDDIRKSSYKVGDINQLYAIIKNCLNETLERLGKKDFDDLRYNGYNGWKEEISTSQDMFSLIVDDISSLDKNPKSTENIIKNLIKKNIEIQVSKIPLYGNFTTGKLIEKLIEMFAKKSIKLSIENIEDIKSFISQNFKNSKGKNFRSKEIKNKSFFNEHIKFIKSILIDCIKKGNIKCTEKDIARIIHKSLPELGELKTIENY
jgi:hypothetical protein